MIGDGVRWDSGVVPLDQPSPDAVEDWWCDQGGEVLKECLESDGGGLHDPGVPSDLPPKLTDKKKYLKICQNH